MHSHRQQFSRAFRLACVTLCLINVAFEATARIRIDTGRNRIRFVDVKPAGYFGAGALSYTWNVGDRGLPLLGLPESHLAIELDQSLTYPLDQFNYPLFQALTYDEEHGRY